MKSILGSFRMEKNVKGFELLSESEMQVVRGGTEPLKPISRPREIFDPEED